MGKKRTSDSTNVSQAINYTSFQEYLYNNRLSWTRHVIPVSYRCPHTSLYMEGYISSAVTNTTGDEDVEEDTDQEISLKSPILIRAAVLSNKFNPLLEINTQDIYPSRRSLSKIKDKDKFGEVQLEYYVSDTDITKFFPTNVLPVKQLYKLEYFYKEALWTKEELAAMLCRSTSDPEFDKFLSKEKPVASRICKIKGIMSDVYKVPKEEKVEKKTTNTVHKVVNNITDLRNQYNTCNLCELGVLAIARGCKPVFGRGNTTNPTYFMIGEAPGTEEEASGIPFNSGAPAGKLLAEMLEKAGITESQYYVTNSVLCRPQPEEGSKSLNGKPDPEHISYCNARLKNELLLLKPKAIILIGKFAYLSYMGEEPESVINRSGIQDTTSGPKVLFVPHPSYILRTINAAKPSDRDLVKENYAKFFMDLKNQINAI